MKKSKIFVSSLVLMLAVGTAFAFTNHKDFTYRYKPTTSTCSTFTSSVELCSGGSNTCNDGPSGKTVYDQNDTSCQTPLTKP
jgi:hypothetical protein